MDTGAALTTYSSFLSGEAMAASASLAAAAVLFVSYSRRQRVRLRSRKKADPPNMSSRTAAETGAMTGMSGRLLSGDYRGRFVELDVAESGLLYVTVSVVNDRRLFEEFDAGGVLPRTAWLSAGARQRLLSLGERWTVAVRGRKLLFSCAVTGYDPERMRRLLDLSCDLADGIDGVYAA